MFERDKRVQELINYIEEGQKRIDSAKMELIKLTDDFDIWEKYCILKTQYPFILPRNSPLMILLEEYCKDLLEKRYSVIDLEWVLELLNGLLKEGIVSKYKVEEVKKYLQRINFGSMKINW